MKPLTVDELIDMNGGAVVYDKDGDEWIKKGAWWTCWGCRDRSSRDLNESYGPIYSAESVLVAITEAEQSAHPDPVNHPSHYKFDNGVEVIDLTEQLSFNCGNAVKYLARAGRKTDDPIQDLLKAEFYVKREIARLQAQGKL